MVCFINVLLVSRESATMQSLSNCFGQELRPPATLTGISSTWIKNLTNGQKVLTLSHEVVAGKVLRSHLLHREDLLSRGNLDLPPFIF